MSEAFENWLESLNLKPEECVSLYMAYNAGRAYQREVDAGIAEAKADEWQESESGKWPEMQENAETGCRSVEWAIREQKIDD